MPIGFLRCKLSPRLSCFVLICAWLQELLADIVFSFGLFAAPPIWQGRTAFEMCCVVLRLIVGYFCRRSMSLMLWALM